MYVVDWPILGRKSEVKSEIPKSTEPSRSLISNTRTLETIRDFLSASKPPKMTPVDVLHICYLTLKKAEDHGITDSLQTLARAFGCDLKTVQRSQERLVKHGWLSRIRRRGRTSELSLNIENIPHEAALRVKITPEARQLALLYQLGLRKHFGRKKFPKYWLENQALSAQRILNECAGDLALARKILGHAVSHPLHRGKSKKSLYELFGRWPKIMVTYAAKTQSQSELQPPVIEQPQANLEVAA